MTDYDRIIENSDSLSDMKAIMSEDKLHDFIDDIIGDDDISNVERVEADESFDPTGEIKPDDFNVVKSDFSDNDFNDEDELSVEDDLSIDSDLSIDESDGLNNNNTDDNEDELDIGDNNLFDDNNTNNNNNNNNNNSSKRGDNAGSGNNYDSGLGSSSEDLSIEDEPNIFDDNNKSETSKQPQTNKGSGTVTIDKQKDEDINIEGGILEDNDKTDETDNRSFNKDNNSKTDIGGLVDADQYKELFVSDNLLEYDEVSDSYRNKVDSRDTTLEEDPDTDYEKKTSAISYGSFILPAISPIALYIIGIRENGDNKFSKKSALKILDFQLSFLLYLTVSILLFGVTHMIVIGVFVLYVLMSLYGAKKSYNGDVWNPPLTLRNWI